jgi:hypothetical protein
MSGLVLAKLANRFVAVRRFGDNFKARDGLDQRHQPLADDVMVFNDQ